MAPPRRLERTSPLHEWHVAQGARLGAVGDVIVPICYRSFERELHELRHGAAFLDLSPYGLLRVSGPDPERFLNRFFTIQTVDRPAGFLVEGLLCTTEGHVVDLVRIIYQANHILLLTTPGRIEAVAAELAEQAILEGISIEPLHETQALLALVGPKARDAVAAVLKNPSFALQQNETLVASIFTARVLLAHLVLCGEPAWLILVGSSYAPIVLERLLESGVAVAPCGAAATDIARIEAGEVLPLFEADRDVLPVELGMMDHVDRNKKDYHGRDAVIGSAQLGQGNWLVSIVMREQVIPRRNAAVVAEGRVVGWVTSGAYSPRDRTGIGLAMIDRTFSIIGNRLLVQMRGQSFPAEIGPRPLVPARAAKPA